MDIVINLDPFFEYISQPIDVIMWQAFYTVGWIPIAFIILWGAREIWLISRKGKWAAENAKFILLAIDIPPRNQQSPRAVENLFTYLQGTQTSPNLIEKYWDGKFQLSFSFEIVSTEGYTQFVIYTPENYRNIIESAIYSQYPDAEITEIDDYTKDFPSHFPDEEYDLWGTEFVQVNSPALPIRTYEEFEHNFGEPETTFRDPMASLMDLCSSLGRGEHLWYQIIITPMLFEWTKNSDAEISKILKEKVAYKKHLGDVLVDWFMLLIDAFSEAVYKLWSETDGKKEDKDETLKMMNLKPKEKKQVEAIHNKMSKIAYESKMRMAYVARKEVMNKNKVVNGFMGYLHQFSALDLNNLKPDSKKTMTSADYFFKTKRLNEKKTKLMINYKNRDDWAGSKSGILNIEELATLWHFPIEASVGAPLIQKSVGKKAEPPMSLPISEDIVSEDLKSPTANIDSIFELYEDKPKNTRETISSNIIFDDEDNEEDIKTETVDEPPMNLPIVK